MNILKNRELYTSVLASAIISATASIAAFVWEPEFGIFTIILCAALIAAQLFSAYSRYKKIAGLSRRIDLVLHGEDEVLIAGAEEGETAILADEIMKMTVTLREQREQNTLERARLSDFIADISHQIKTPLTTANLLLQRVMTEPDVHQRTELCENLMRIMRRLDELVTAMLKISRLDAGAVKFKKEKVDAAELMRRVCNSMGITAEIREQTLICSGEGFFTGDYMWTAEAMTNIIKNCSEHTPVGGEIKAEVSENALYTEITVTDTGTGFDSSDLAHIFERFYKGKGQDKGGFGIGLSLSKRIIESQNGIISAENAPQKGARFTVRFYKGNV